MTDTLTAWNCPAAYVRDYDRPSGWHDWPRDIKDAYRAATHVPNWFWEQDAALEAMIKARDAEAIREWADYDTFLAVARATGDPDDDEDNRAYAQRCVDALEELAEAVEGWKPRTVDISIRHDGWVEWAGTGTLDEGGQIECGADIPQAVYDGIESAISHDETSGDIEADGETYVWQIND